MAEVLESRETERTYITPRRRSYVEPLKGDFAEKIFDEVVRKADSYDHPDFKKHYKFNKKTGLIEGSNTRWVLLTDMELRKKGKWIPTPYEAKQRDKEGKLSDKVYREFGLVIFDIRQPNADLAEYFSKESNRRGFKSPVILPFKSLFLKEKTGDIIFSDDLSEVVHGDEALNFLEDFYVNNSGVRGLDCDGGGSWDAYWIDLGYSGALGRVDQYGGEATAQNFREEYEAKLEEDLESLMIEVNSEYEKKKGEIEDLRKRLKLS